jgi:hypothetical protein
MEKELINIDGTIKVSKIVDDYIIFEVIGIDKINFNTTVKTIERNKIILETSKYSLSPNIRTQIRKYFHKTTKKVNFNNVKIELSVYEPFDCKWIDGKEYRYHSNSILSKINGLSNDYTVNGNSTLYFTVSLNADKHHCTINFRTNEINFIPDVKPVVKKMVPKCVGVFLKKNGTTFKELDLTIIEKLNEAIVIELDFNEDELKSIKRFLNIKKKKFSRQEIVE